MMNILKYMYVVNYPTFEEELCLLEMREVFGSSPQDKVLFSNIKFNPSNSPFIKNRLDIIFEKDTIEEIIEELNKNNNEDNRVFNNFKLEYIRLNSENIPYEERLSLTRKISMNIVGSFNLKNPEFNFGITKINNKWVFGMNNKNDYKWHEHDNKPCSYSNSLSVKVAKAIVNIASGGCEETRIIDPCCGVGTTIIEGLDANYQIEGYEINKQIAINANINLEFYGFEPIVIEGDMHNIKKKYDTSIIDIPYGIFSHTSVKEQQDIINTARRISNKMVMISFENHDLMIEEGGFEIIDRCIVTKGKFKRYIVVAR
ncbi:MAG: TRM11 family SAM-dependent methyltransferase [Fusobacteriaceae bacterium]